MHGYVPYMVWEYGDNGGFGLLRIHRTGGAKQATTVYLVRKQKLHRRTAAAIYLGAWHGLCPCSRVNPLPQNEGTPASRHIC